jgi:beta-glucosidase
MNAGLDMYMAPDSWKGLYDNTLAQVKSGEIPMARLDDAVRRILRVKVKTGLFERVAPTVQGRFDRLGAAEHRAIAREAVAKSLVLLKNDGVLPVKPGARVLVAGAADDIGKASGGWTLTWQGTGNKNSDFPHGQSIWGGIEQAVKAAGGQAELAPDGKFTTKPDVAIVVFGEDPYAEFQGDVTNLGYQLGDKTDLALLKKLKAQGIPVVSVFLSGRPLWVNPEINASDAFVAAWLPGSEGGGVADVLVAGKDGKSKRDFQGKLGFSWPKRADQGPLNRGQPGYDPQFAYGYGLSYAKPGKVGVLPENPAMWPPPAASIAISSTAGCPRPGGWISSGRVRSRRSTPGPRRTPARRPGAGRACWPSTARRSTCRARPPATWRCWSVTGSTPPRPAR